jgi:predicted MFS family arabinose efflux permease
MAELIGMLGTSGFVGVVVGTQLGDLLVVGWREVRGIFVVGGSLALLAAVFAAAATAGYSLENRPIRTSTWRVVRSFGHLSFIILGMAMGIGLGLPPVFLPAMAKELGIERIGLFFAVYAPVAVLTRIWTRGLFGRWDLRLLAGASMVLVAVAHWSLTLVRAEWMLPIPGLIFGIAHAVVYPSVVAIGATRFPSRFRGLGTSLMLASYDVGLVLGAPLASLILELARQGGLPTYPTMLLSSGAILCVMTGVFAATAPAPRAAKPPLRLPRAVSVGDTPTARRSAPEIAADMPGILAGSSDDGNRSQPPSRHAVDALRAGVEEGPRSGKQAKTAVSAAPGNPR